MNIPICLVAGFLIFLFGVFFGKELERAIQADMADLANGQDDMGYRPTLDTTVITTDDVDATDKYGIDGHSNL